MEVPLMLTVAIEENASLFFNALRKIYLPDGEASDAHLALFHLLPHDPAVLEAVELASREFNPMRLEVKEPSVIGDEVVYRIESEELVQLHDMLMKQWQSFLLPQDQQLLSPVIVIQKEAPAAEANELLQFLKDTFSGFSVQGTGLQLWEYRDGPWRIFHEYPFTPNEIKL